MKCLVVNGYEMGLPHTITWVIPFEQCARRLFMKSHAPHCVQGCLTLFYHQTLCRMAYSVGEINYCVLNIQHGLRLDGRSPTHYRSMELSLGPIAQASGSARLRLGDTDVIVGVKAEVGSPGKAHPDCGRLQVSVECSACASPEYEGRGGEAWAQQLGHALQAALSPPSGSMKGPAAALLRSLGIIPGKAAWSLFVDALVLNDAGGVLSALSIASLAALHNTRLPKVTVTQGEGGEADGEPEIELDDDGTEGVPLQGVDALPVVVSLAAVGQTGVVCDPDLLEERAARSVLHVAADVASSVCGVQQEGREGFPAVDLLAATHTAAQIAPKLLSALAGHVVAHSSVMIG